MQQVKEARKLRFRIFANCSCKIPLQNSVSNPLPWVPLRSIDPPKGPFSGNSDVLLRGAELGAVRSIWKGITNNWREVRITWITWNTWNQKIYHFQSFWDAKKSKKDQDSAQRRRVSFRSWHCYEVGFSWSQAMAFCATAHQPWRSSQWTSRTHPASGAHQRDWCVIAVLKDVWGCAWDCTHCTCHHYCFAINFEFFKFHHFFTR